MNRPVRKIRCAVYTRKSSEDGLEQEFNSLDAQREACEAYITSQRSEGWVILPESYEDGGISGGTMKRPGLQKLFDHIKSGLVDVIVVYKIDRLTRSLADFARMVDLFDKHDVTFVSITQQFNTTTSMGRLTLNILLSFAQFEREVTAERIRDKFAASRKKGMWMGGLPPLGYDVKLRKLVVNEKEAELVREIFSRFIKVGSGTILARQLAREGKCTKSWITQKGHLHQGKPMTKSYLYKLLNNRVYIGEAVHKGTSYPGEHEAIVPRELWDKVHAILRISPRLRGHNTRRRTPALLKGLIFGADGRPMTPTHTRRKNRLYRYYVAAGIVAGQQPTGVVRRVPAEQVESAVIAQIQRLIRTPGIITATWRALRQSQPEASEDEVRKAFASFPQLWDELFPAEQERVLQLLTERVVVHEDHLDVRLRVEGLRTLAMDMQGGQAA